MKPKWFLGRNQSGFFPCLENRSIDIMKKLIITGEISSLKIYHFASGQKRLPQGVTKVSNVSALITLISDLGTFSFFTPSTPLIFRQTSNTAVIETTFKTNSWFNKNRVKRKLRFGDWPKARFGVGDTITIKGYVKSRYRHKVNLSHVTII